MFILQNLRATQLAVKAHNTQTGHWCKNDNSCAISSLCTHSLQRFWGLYPADTPFIKVDSKWPSKAATVTVPIMTNNFLRHVLFNKINDTFLVVRLKFAPLCAQCCYYPNRQYTPKLVDFLSQSLSCSSQLYFLRRLTFWYLFCNCKQIITLCIVRP